MKFDDIIAKVKECGKKTVAVSVAQDEAVLEAVKAAKKQGIADAILVGDEAKIREIAASIDMDLSEFEIIDEPDMVAASLKAVKLAHDGRKARTTDGGKGQYDHPGQRHTRQLLGVLPGVRIRNDLDFYVGR